MQKGTWIPIAPLLPPGRWKETTATWPTCDSSRWFHQTEQFALLSLSELWVDGVSSNRFEAVQSCDMCHLSIYSILFHVGCTHCEHALIGHQLFPWFLSTASSGSRCSWTRSWRPANISRDLWVAESGGLSSATKNDYLAENLPG